MKKVVSPTGCVHAVDRGHHGAWVTKCNHRDYFNMFDGHIHRWDLTNDEVTCKRCLAILIREAGPMYTEEIVYHWPATQVCVRCKYSTYAEIGEDYEGNQVVCEQKCKLNDGKSCPMKEEI